MGELRTAEPEGKRPYRQWEKNNKICKKYKFRVWLKCYSVHIDKP
jgi:hypothetical protein